MVLSTQQERRFKSWMDLFCVEFASSPCACVGFLQDLLPPSAKKHASWVSWLF